LAERGAALPASDVPRTDLERCWARYRAFAAQRDAGRVRSAHVCGRGGLAVALAHMVLAAELGLEIELDEPGDVPAAALLFAESTGRIVLTCAESHASALEQALTQHGLVALGRTVAQPCLRVQLARKSVLSRSLAQLRAAFEGGLHGL
jgi:phosphoribosylformylglycinamidine synthase